MKKIITMVLVAATAVAVLAGCGKKDAGSAYKNDVKVADITAKVAETLGDDYWCTEKITDADAATLYSLTADNCDEILAEVPMMATNADMIIVVKAKSDKVDAVKTELEALRQTKVDDTMQYPMNIQKIAASSVEVIGEYVVYVQLGGDAVDAETDEAIKTGCEEDNKAALDAIKELLKK